MVSPPNKCNCALEIVAMTEFSEKDERNCKNQFKKLLTSSETNNPTNNDSFLKFIHVL